MKLIIRSVLRFILWWCFWHPATPPSPEYLSPIRVIETKRIHLGVRPGITNGGYGITIQLSWQ